MKNIKKLFKRRQILIGATALTSAALLAGCKEKVDGGTPDNPKKSATISRGIIEWKMVTTWPKNFPALGTGAQRIADSIGEMSEGQLVVKLYAGGELVPPFECFDAVSQGTAQMSHGVSYYWINKNRSTPFFATVPGGLTAQEQDAWIHYGGGQELWDELYSNFNLKAFLGGNSGVQMGGWFRNEIKSLDDFKGLKMRMPGLGAEVINRMGATAVSMPGGEIMPSLESGAIDATEWVGPYNDLAFGFYQVAKYYYGPGFHEPGTQAECMVNKEEYDKLPKHLQKIVEHASVSENNKMLAEFTYGNSAAQRKLVDTHGVIMNNFPKEVYDTMFKISEEVVAETANDGEINKKIYNSWIKFKEDVRVRAPYAEQGYMERRG